MPESSVKTGKIVVMCRQFVRGKTGSKLLLWADGEAGRWEIG